MNLPARPQLTTLAGKYTHPVGTYHKVIAGTGKSGMTPISSPVFPNRNQRRRYEELDAYQRRRFEAFSTKEIEDVEAFAPSFPTDTLPFPIPTNQINPLFGPSKWNVNNPDSVPLFLMHGQAGGYWQVSYYTFDFHKLILIGSKSCRLEYPRSLLAVGQSVLGESPRHSLVGSHMSQQFLMCRIDIS